jgi:hypothetical protein
MLLVCVIECRNVMTLKFSGEFPYEHKSVYNVVYARTDVYSIRILISHRHIA